MILLGALLSACGGGNVNNPLTAENGLGAPNPEQQAANAEGKVGEGEGEGEARPDLVKQAQSRINATSAERVRTQKGVKVAILLPLGAKGGAAKVARALKRAGELALFDFNDPNVVLTAKDTKGTPAGARAAATEAINSGAELILGPLFSKNVTAAASIAKKANVPMVAFSSDRKVAGDGVYLLSFLAGQDVDRVVSFAVGRGKRRLGALIPDTPYGHLVEAAFNKAASRHGGEIVLLKRFPVDPNGMLKPIEEMAALARTKTPIEKDEETGEVTGGEAVEPQIDALFIPAGAKVIPTLSPILPYFDIDTKAVKLIGTGSWDYRDIGREKPMRSAWFPGPAPKGWRNFTKRYAETYGKPPPRIASLAYDAVSLAVSLSKMPRGSRYAKRQLTRASGFSGVDGLFRLQPDGTSERGLAVLEVQKFGPRVIDRAPSIFSSRTAASTRNGGGLAGLNPF